MVDRVSWRLANEHFDLGDTNSMWGNMYFGISQALAFGIAGIPYFGVETCGFK